MINETFEKDKYPNILKECPITPLHKKGDN